MFSRLVGSLMKHFDRKDMQVQRDSRSGQFIARDACSTGKNDRTYASQESLKRAVVKVVKQHRSALEWLADK